MVKNRTAQLIFQSAYCALGILGSISCLGIFDDYTDIRWDFYIYFTNISNFLCLGVMLAELVQTAKKKDDSFVSAVPLLKFIAMLGIMLTFFVFNILLAGDREPQLNFRVNSVLFHLVLPIMYVADWVVFYEHKKVKWVYPLVSTAFPLGYVAFIFIRSAILGFDIENYTLYPYFFLDLDKQGVGGVASWIGILFAAFVVAGYIFMGLDRLIKCKKS